VRTARIAQRRRWRRGLLEFPRWSAPAGAGPSEDRFDSVAGGTSRQRPGTGPRDGSGSGPRTGNGDPATAPGDEGPGDPGFSSVPVAPLILGPVLLLALAGGVIVWTGAQSGPAHSSARRGSRTAGPTTIDDTRFRVSRSRGQASSSGAQDRSIGSMKALTIRASPSVRNRDRENRPAWVGPKVGPNLPSRVLPRPAASDGRAAP
jgi:hypothetical protein